MRTAILDTETTGLPFADWSRVVELAAVAVDEHGRTIAEFDSLMRPDVLDSRALRALSYSGIDIEEVRVAPETPFVRAAFAAWLLEHDVTRVLSYNEGFDKKMLERSGFRLPWGGCVMRLARASMPPRTKDPSLADACEHFCIHHGNKHRAIGDARAAAALWKGLVSA